jgi:hypothetical protein
MEKESQSYTSRQLNHLDFFVFLRGRKAFLFLARQNQETP